MRKSPFTSFALFILLTLTAVLTTACGSMRPHISFGATPVGQVACPALVAAANLTIANSPACKNPAPFSVAFCLLQQTAASAFVASQCAPDAVPAPIPAGRTTTRAAAAVPEDPRLAVQQIYEGLGMSPAQAAKEAARVVRP